MSHNKREKKGRIRAQLRARLGKRRFRVSSNKSCFLVDVHLQLRSSCETFFHVGVLVGSSFCREEVLVGELELVERLKLKPREMVGMYNLPAGVSLFVECSIHMFFRFPVNGV